MAFTGALSTFVWSNLGWMRWVPEQGELSSSVHYRTADWPCLSLFIFPCCTWNSPGRCSPVNACHWSPGTSSGLPWWLLGPADSQLLKVWLTEGSRSNRSSRSSVSVLNLLPRVGGGLWGEEREGGRSDEAAASCVCSIWCWMCLFICQPFSSRSGLTQPVVCWSGFEIDPLHPNLPTSPVCTGAAASVAEGSERSLPDNARLASLCCCQTGEERRGRTCCTFLWRLGLSLWRCALL